MQLGNVRDVSVLCDGWKLQAADASEHLEGVTLVEQSRTNLGGCFMCCYVVEADYVELQFTIMNRAPTRAFS